MAHGQDLQLPIPISGSTLPMAIHGLQSAVRLLRLIRSRVAPVSSAATAVVTAPTFPSGAILGITFDDSDFSDVTDNGYGMTNNNGVGLAAGIRNDAGDFSPGACYLSASAQGHMNFADGGFSISLWINPYAPVEGFVIPLLILSPRLLILIRNDVDLVNSISIVIGGPVEDSPATITTGAWTHLCFVRKASDGSTDLYINGAFVYNFSITVGVEFADDQVLIGTANDSLGSFTPNGLIDELFVFGREISSDEVALLYGGGTPPAYAP